MIKKFIIGIIIGALITAFHLAIIALVKLGVNELGEFYLNFFFVLIIGFVSMSTSYYWAERE